LSLTELVGTGDVQQKAAARWCRPPVVSALAVV